MLMDGLICFYQAIVAPHPMLTGAAGNVRVENGGITQTESSICCPVSSRKTVRVCSRVWYEELSSPTSLIPLSCAARSSSNPGSVSRISSPARILKISILAKVFRKEGFHFVERNYVRAVIEVHVACARDYKQMLIVTRKFYERLLAEIAGMGLFSVYY